MSHLPVITFDDAEQVGELRETPRQEQKEDLISLEDAAVVVRDKQGKFHVKNETASEVAMGAIGGGLLGLLIGAVFFPVAGLLIGAIGGARNGHLDGQGERQNLQVLGTTAPCCATSPAARSQRLAWTRAQSGQEDNGH